MCEWEAKAARGECGDWVMNTSESMFPAESSDNSSIINYVKGQVEETQLDVCFLTVLGGQ